MGDAVELIHSIGRANIIAIFDLLKGYWAIPMDEESKNVISFKTHRQQYRFKQYCNKTSATVDTNYFSTVIRKIKDEFADRFEQFKITLAFIVNPLNINCNEIHIQPLGIDTGSLEMQLIDLKAKALRSEKFTELWKSKLKEWEVQKCMNVTQQLTALKKCRELWHLYSKHGIVFQIATVR
ncbi:general transcription factor II-I repeat domain-containing protein 2A [Trichonephila clavipes]|nr:general transcription factor II-I repeat domain-containing protein 2A [Trichonephila clavipes]